MCGPGRRSGGELPDLAKVEAGGMFHFRRAFPAHPAPALCIRPCTKDSLSLICRIKDHCVFGRAQEAAGPLPGPGPPDQAGDPGAAGGSRRRQRQRPGAPPAPEPAKGVVAPDDAQAWWGDQAAEGGAAGLLLARPGGGPTAPARVLAASRREAPNGSEHMSRQRPTENGEGSGKVRVAIVGVGNCASSLVQGVQYYRDAPPDEFVPGLMHVDLGGYHVRDVEFVAAFDIDRTKVDKDLSEAIWQGPNNTVKFAEVPHLDVRVHRGMTHDGIGKYVSEIVRKAPGETDDVVGILREARADVVVNYLPVGSEEATKWYVEQALTAGCAFVNCMPVFIAREHYWQGRFESKGLLIIDDDVKQ